MKINIRNIKGLNKLRKEADALKIIKNKSLIWVENGKLKCGNFGDVEIIIDEDRFDNKEEYELLKEVLEDDR